MNPMDGAASLLAIEADRVKSEMFRRSAAPAWACGSALGSLQAIVPTIKRGAAREGEAGAIDMLRGLPRSVRGGRPLDNFKLKSTKMDLF